MGLSSVVVRAVTNRDYRDRGHQGEIGEIARHSRPPRASGML